MLYAESVRSDTNGIKTNSKPMSKLLQRYRVQGLFGAKPNSPPLSIPLSIPFSIPLALLASSALAQTPPTPPDAGALRQQIERNQAQPVPRATAPVKPAAPAELNAASATTFEVKTFRFVGNTLLTPGQLEAAVADYAGRTLLFTELQAATISVTKIYRDAGWLVRAFLPEQDVSNGIVTIQIEEAVFGTARLEGAEPLRLKFSSVLRFFEAQQKQNQPLNTDALDRALLLTDDLPGVAVAGALQAGQAAGQTDLVLKMSDEPLLLGETGIDNTGSRATGDVRATLSASLQSPLGLGDLLTMNAIKSQGSEYLRVGYSLPVDRDGWRAGVNASTLRYRIITPEFEALNPNGRSDSVGLEATYPLVRSRQRNVYLQANLDQKDFLNESNQTLQSAYRINALTVGVATNSFDILGGGGANAASISYVSGQLDLGTLNPSENTALAGAFGKWRANVSRQQVLSEQFTLYGSLAVQRGSQELDSSENFTLGGSTGVRAYPSGEGRGVSGQVATLELRARLSAAVNVNAFYDWGTVHSLGAKSSYQLAGSGLSVAWMAPWGGSVRATYARRIGGNPNPTTTGRDQDGSLDIDRWWLTAALPF